MKNILKVGNFNRYILSIAVFCSLCFSPSPAQAFWFFNRGSDALKARDTAAKLKEEYYELLADPDATDEEIEAAELAWRFATQNGLSKIREFATSVPGTSLTGPPPTTAKELAVELLKEALKEVLGEVSNENSRKFPTDSSSNGTNITSNASSPENSSFFGKPNDGEFVGTEVFDTIPVNDFDQSVISSFDFSYLAPEDYDFSEGEPPPNFFQSTSPILLIQGTFTNIGFDDFGICTFGPTDTNLVSTTNTTENIGCIDNPETYTASSLQEDLGLSSSSKIPNSESNMGNNEKGFLSGIVADGAVEAVIDTDPDWDPFNRLSTGAPQITLVTITSVDTENNTISGNFFSATVERVPEPSSNLGILALGTLGFTLNLKRKLKSHK